jgi:hypothetical protein
MMTPKAYSLRTIQWITWVVLFAVHMVAMLPNDSWLQALLYTVVNISSYALIVYGNAFGLIPGLYNRGRRTIYIIVSVFFIVVMAMLRYGTLFWVYNRFFAEKPTPFRWSGSISSLISAILIFVSSILFYFALHFFRLQQRQRELEKEKAEAELNLLKAQVQPHFLFNTLNNIYFVAQKESPATAELLEQLSRIMRYFVDEAPKKNISIGTELAFINSYIGLEKMRMRYPLRVAIEAVVPEELLVPPMLLIPLVENVFKHGVDKLRSDNFISIRIQLKGNYMCMEVENRVAGNTYVSGGTGLKNLHARLALLYEARYQLITKQEDGAFLVSLNIPL